jgi:hypothetical protein
MLHNPHLRVAPALYRLYEKAKLMADCVVPQEYGVTIEEKRDIGTKVSKDSKNQVLTKKHCKYFSSLLPFIAFFRTARYHVDIQRCVGKFDSTISSFMTNKAMWPL